MCPDIFIIASEPFMRRGLPTRLIGPFLSVKAAKKWIKDNDIPERISFHIEIVDAP